MGKKRKRRKVGKRGPESYAARDAGIIFTVTHKEAIARLLDTAIWMWFDERDSLAVHLLACAGYQCLDDLGRETRKGPILKAEIQSDFFAGYDYLRHADENPHAELDFAPSLNPPILFDATLAFERIFGNLTLFMRTFRAYYTIHPEPYVTEAAQRAAQEFLPDGITVAEAQQLSRRAFFAEITEVSATQYGAVRRGHIKSP